MSTMKNPELRALIGWLLLCLVALGAAGFVFSRALNAQYQAEMDGHDAAVVGALVQAYPEREVDIMRQLTKAPDTAARQLGREALSKYNYQAASRAAGPLAFWLYAGLCVGVCLLAVCLCLSRIYRHIRRITRYLHQAAQGETPSPLLEAEEGDLGYLANESVKVVGALYHEAARSKDDQAALSRAISDISHQIKTPITSMTMLTDILLEQEVPDDQRAVFLQRLQAQLGRTKWLVDALLKLSKLDSGTVAMEKKEVSCQTLLEHCLLPLYPMIEQRGISYAESGEMNLCFWGDLSWTTEAVGNILKNCIEHTPEGGAVTVRASGNPLYTELLVCDTGEGIDPEDLPHLFERFYRGKNASPDSVGIGLALARSILEKQGAVVDVTSKQGQGSCFSLRFYHGVV